MRIGHVALAFAVTVLMTGLQSVWAQGSDSVSCEVPYTVGRQQTLVEAYGRIAAGIGNAIPTKADSPIVVDAFYANSRSIIAGEALQALSDVRSAYVCILKSSLPENKHWQIDVISKEIARVTAAAFLPNNWDSMENVLSAYDFLDARLATGLPELKNVQPADRVSSAEILSILGSPDFQSRSETRAGIEAVFGPISGGACLGLVKATLAAVDNATISAMAAHASVGGCRGRRS